MVTDFRSSLVLLGGVVVLVVTYHVIRTIYDVYFGPLSEIPGPKLAAATRLVLLWHKLHGNADHYVVGLHAQYGDIVRKGPGDISFATGHAWKDIYGFHSGSKAQQFPKDPKVYGTRPKGVTDIVWSNEADHSRFRRNFSHAFSDRALREQEPLLRQYVDLLIEKLSTKTGEKIDLVRWYNYTTFDIMADLAYGEALGCLDAGSYTAWVSMVFQSVKVGSYMMEANFLPYLRPFIKACIPKGSMEKRKVHWDLSYKQVDKRLAREDPRPDIWGIVLSAKEEQQLSLNEMHSNSQVFMVAGTETTATLLSGLTFKLLENPQKMAAVVKEVRESFRSADEISVDSVLRLNYLNACFEEGLRCYPPVPTGLPRMVPASGDVVCGQALPGGTRVSVHQLSTYSNPRNFRRPNEFIPERWLGDPEFANDDRAALQPFSVGPRNCIGKNLAYLEMRLILANVLWHYDLTLCGESRNWTDQKTYTLWEKNPLMVQLQLVTREK